MTTVTKRFKFCYGHHLPNYMGKCQYVHGHNATLDVEVDGCDPGIKSQPYPTMIVDFGDLKDVVEKYIIGVLDHHDANAIFPVPTAEAMLDWIVGNLQITYGSHLIRVRLYETDDSWAEWRK